MTNVLGWGPRSLLVREIPRGGFFVDRFYELSASNEALRSTLELCLEMRF